MSLFLRIEAAYEQCTSTNPHDYQGDTCPVHEQEGDA